MTENGAGMTRRRAKSPPSSPINALPSSSSALDGIAQSDDLSPFPAGWYDDGSSGSSSGGAYPFLPMAQQLQQLHLQQPHQQQFQSSMASDEPSAFQQIAGFHCPICLRIAQIPIRQECGHVLCLQCTQQAISMFGSCPLCRTQLIFGGNNGRAVNGGGVMESGYPTSQSASELASGQVRRLLLPSPSEKRRCRH